MHNFWEVKNHEVKDHQGEDHEGKDKHSEKQTQGWRDSSSG